MEEFYLKNGIQSNDNELLKLFLQGLQLLKAKSQIPVTIESNKELLYLKNIAQNGLRNKTRGILTRA